MKGGYRLGAGRKRGFAAKGAEEARRLFSERVAEEIGPICEALIKQAKKGDIKAIHELFDRAWGKAPQGIDIGGSGLEQRSILIISHESSQRFGLPTALNSRA